jgi:hypothetical protein
MTGNSPTGRGAPPRARLFARRRIPVGALRLRPNPLLFRQAIAALLAFAIPAFGVVYFVTVPDGAWLPVLVTQAAVSATFLLATWAFFRVGIWVHPDAIVERGFFGAVIRVRSEQIASTVLVHTYYGGGAETVPQFFVCDHDGRQLVRMRGQFWSPENMATVRDTLGVPTSELTEGVSTKDILEHYPGLLYWFERRPALAVGALGATLAAGGSALYLGISLAHGSAPLAF